MPVFDLVLVKRIADHCGYCTDAENFPQVKTTYVRDVNVGGTDFSSSLTLGSVITDKDTLREHFSSFFRDGSLGGDSYFCNKCSEWSDVTMHEYAEEVCVAILVSRDSQY